MHFPSFFVFKSLSANNTATINANMADSIFPIISGNTNLGFVWHVKAKKSPIAQFAPIMKAALIKAPFNDIFLQDFHPLPKFVEKIFSKNGYIFGNHLFVDFQKRKKAVRFAYLTARKAFF